MINLPLQRQQLQHFNSSCNFSFWIDFRTQFGINLAPSWATLVQELVLNGLVGLREALRIFDLGALDPYKTPFDPINRSRDPSRSIENENSFNSNLSRAS